ncbi:UvrD-helicase domain-containing protein [Dictyobacter kobayashii]|uniref:DNA 3'-5' helicase n=1 Tax=Dictyobacter kobayashii TaxID=2014872 RepID=A0A402AG21_9CHLR|nr:UvrD-helicase domain-containing protein [Dictyobacter kobayashii]GCE18061.1 DNA helicase [Dictyobacter kobayashii]
MDNALRLTVEAAARLVLEEYRKDNPAWTNDITPIDNLAEWLGLHIGTFNVEDYAQGTYGFMDPDEEEDLIWICRTLNETFRRFTLAHEIGHALLHCRNGLRLQRFSEQYNVLFSAQVSYASIPEPSPTHPCHDNDIQEDMATFLEQELMQEKIGNPHGYDPRSERELAANVFAAELLMPAARLYTLYVQEAVPAHVLAARFAVSPAALLNRLAGFLSTTPTVKVAEEDIAAKPARVDPAAATAKKRYDEFQQAAIEAETPALIVAGPGSGKTSTLIGRADYLINTLQIPSQHILALTFSRKATLEMEERLQQLLSQSGQTLPTISTFHAFCANLLRQYGTLIGLRPDFSLVDEAEGYLMLRQQANAMKLHHYRLLQTPTHYFPDMLKAIARAKDELVTPEQYLNLAQAMQAQASDEKVQVEAEKALEVAQVYALYQQELQRRGDTDYGGLLVSAIQLLNEHPAVLAELQHTFEHILVDEFQDVNRASGVLLRVLAGTAGRVWVVGDANQAIYGFRGASPANISQFEQDFPGARILPLSRNYRSRPDLVAIAESFRCQQLEFGQEIGKNQPVRLTNIDTYVTIAKAPDEASEIASLIEDIRNKQSQGYAFKDMVVLCRTRSQANKITAALMDANLPVIEQGGILEQEHIKDVLSAILLIPDSSGMGLLRLARLPEHALSQADIEALLLATREPGKTVRSMLISGELPLTISIEGRHTLLRISHTLQALLRAPNIWFLLAQYLFIETSLIRSLLARPGDKLSSIQLASYQQLLQLARHYDQQLLLRQKLEQQSTSHAGTGAAEVSEPLSIEEQVRDFLDYLRLLVQLRQDSGSRQNSNDEADAETDTINVMTVHASKGLEFPVVYMPGLMQRRFPTSARSGSIKPPLGMLSTENNSHEVGEACLFYVGVTRARDQLVLSYSERYGKAQQKYQRSPYLDALEAGLGEDRIIKQHWNQHYAGTLLEENDIVGIHSSQPGEEFIAAMSPPTLSTYAIESYLYCPRKYVYSSIYHFEDQPDGYRLFTQATRKTVEAIHKQLDESKDPARLPSQQEIQELYIQHWQDLGGHTEPFATMYEEHGQQVVESIRRRLHSQEEVSWQLQPGYNVEIAGTRVHVPIDRVETANTATQQPDRFIRTSYGRAKEKHDPRPKDLLYHLAYRQQYPGQSVEVHSHNMSTGENTPITITAKKEKNLYQEVEQAVKGLEEHRYPAQPKDAQRCPGCPFFFICPA